MVRLHSAYESSAMGEDGSGRWTQKGRGGERRQWFFPVDASEFGDGQTITHLLVLPRRTVIAPELENVPICIFAERRDFDLARLPSARA